MSQGTISILFGCHSPIHSILVVLAWRKLYGRWPAFWQAVCIFLHDIGHIGLDYLDDYEQKKIHWVCGATIASLLFGKKGYEFSAGHTSHSGVDESPLRKADKYAWVIAPGWWLWSNTFFEPKLRMGYSRAEAVRRFKADVKKNWDAGLPRSTHDLYLKRCQ